ncbi:MAG: thiamine-phosphate kinase [Nitrosomonas sp.]|nr:thiamine-phosphate kinase [Nitrosomonas sp.]
MHSEFDIIRQYFTRPVTKATLGVGDDAALITASIEKELVIAVDTLVSGHHFFADADPRKLGYKALAVNLSDMAAMGANPCWATLSLTVPKKLIQTNKAWLDEFSAGFFELANIYQIELIGGDTTRGPLNICVQIIGEVEKGKAMLRSGAKPDDDIWVSGYLGDAALALAHINENIILDSDELMHCESALNTPIARVELGRQLINLAHSAIDISDGLIADLGHIVECSNVAATINLNEIACSSILKKYLPQPIAVRCLLAGGDDYELCFTASEGKHKEIEELSLKSAIPLTRIGKIKPGKGLTIFNTDSTAITLETKGYDHFGT